MKTVGDKDTPGDDPRIAEFDQGYAAFNDGLDINDNPYSPRHADAHRWENGWSEAKDDAVRMDD